MRVLEAICSGDVTIGETVIPCAVLEDGTRVLSETGIAESFGSRTGGAIKNKKNDIEMGRAPLPVFINQDRLKPFIGNDLASELTNPILYKRGTRIVSGFSAEILPKVCDVWLSARNAGVLQKQQLNRALSAEILMRGLAHVAIIALVDEATGYQHSREKDELQKILKGYISEHLLPWQKTFPDIYYRELFRLNKWDFTVNGIKKRPGVIGKWTRTLVYEELPDGVLAELEKNTPKNKKGNKTVRLHQSLTEDVGHPHLSAQIAQVITLFRLSDNMKHMWHQFEKIRKGGQIDLFEFDENGSTKE